MALTLIEAMKIAQNRGEDYRAAVIETYARSSDVLRSLPFKDIAGAAYAYNQEGTLPGIGFRGVNESWTPSTGVINPKVEMLSIAGGELDVDRFLVKTGGPGVREQHEAMKIKALAQQWHLKFIKGDSSTVGSESEFDGLQVRLAGDQLIHNTTSSGGAALKLNKLDEAIDAVDSPTHIIMSKAMRRYLLSAIRTTGSVGYMPVEKDAFGRPVTYYNDLPILIADANDVASGYAALGFNEADFGGGGNVSTSIYVVSFMEGMLCGIQRDGIDVSDLGEQDASPVYRTRVEWYSGLCLEHPRAAARLDSIIAGTPTT